MRIPGRQETTFADLGVAAWLAITTLAVWVRLRTGGSSAARGLARTLLVPVPGPRSLPVTIRRARIAGRAVNQSGLCLARSILIVELLTRDGIPAAVALGAKKQGEGITAHAWVEVDGVSVLERDAPHEWDHLRGGNGGEEAVGP